MPGAGRSPLASAWAISAVCSSASLDTTSRAWSRRYSRRSVATWSLRLRPARSLPPSEPSRSSSPRSSAVCTSSSATVGRKLPSSTASSRSSRAASIESASASVSRPARCSIRACARDASRSYLASRQSKCTLSDSRASASAGPPSNRPPHNRVAGPPVGCSPVPICPTYLTSSIVGPGTTTLFAWPLACGPRLQRPDLREPVAPRQAPHVRLRARTGRQAQGMISYLGKRRYAAHGPAERTVPDPHGGNRRRSARLRNSAARASPPAGSLAMTRTVSSPATVPRMAGQAAWSMAEARNCAAPAGVRSTTRLALASAEVSSSLRYLTRRDDAPPRALRRLPGRGGAVLARRARLAPPGRRAVPGAAGCRGTGPAARAGRPGAVAALPDVPRPGRGRPRPSAAGGMGGSEPAASVRDNRRRYPGGSSARRDRLAARRPGCRRRRGAGRRRARPGRGTAWPA